MAEKTTVEPAARKAARPLGKLGIFDEETNVGDPALKGRAEFDAARGVYRVSGAGVNIWAVRDEFHFVWRQLPGDVRLTATMRFEGAGTAAHRKAGLMIRRGLEPDAPHACVMIHGDGLTGLQFREKAGDITRGVRFPIVAPVHIRLERRGAAFGLWAACEGAPIQELGSVQFPLGGGPMFVGLAVCSHLANVLETAVFSGVTIESFPQAAKKAK